MSRWRWVVVFLLALALAGTASAAPVDERAQVTTDDQLQPEKTQIEPDQVVIEIALRPDGSARWTVEHRVDLDEPEERAGFNRTMADISSDRSAVREPYARQIRAMATEAEEATDRTMVVENVSVDAYRTGVPDEYGVVEYGFHWYGFAETGEQLRAGDALSRLFLDEETTLLVTWPSDTTLESATPPPDEQRDQTLVWNGRTEFAQDEPRVVLDSDSVAFGFESNLPESNDVFATLSVLGLLVGGVGISAVAWRWRRTGGEQASETQTTAAGSPAAGDAIGAATTPATEPPSDLLSNEEQVLSLLSTRGGRIKQQEVVSELGWSETKTSEVVQTLREADEVEVYRLGRENVIALPETGLGLDTGGDEE
jgi:hypothetical protein